MKRRIVRPSSAMHDTSDILVIVSHVRHAATASLVEDASIVQRAKGDVRTMGALCLALEVAILKRQDALI